MIIGLKGKARSGKSTSARYLTHTHNFVEVSFAHLLKKSVNMVFSWDSRHAYGDLKEVIDPYWTDALGREVTPRWAYQFIGTDLFREMLDNEIWIKALFHELETKFVPETNFVFSDVRFLNEAEALKTQDGIIVEIRKEEREEIGGQDHPSETEMDYIVPDYIIDNDFSFQLLYESLDTIVRENR